MRRRIEVMIALLLLCTGCGDCADERSAAAGDMSSELDMSGSDLPGELDGDAGPTPGDTEPEGLAAFCAGEQPAAGAMGVCGGEIAQTAFRFALCTCEDFNIAGSLSVDAFDSNDGAYMPGEPGGSVGTNGRFSSSSSVDVGGSLWVGKDVSLTAGATVGLDLQVADKVSGQAALTVGRNARIGGDVTLSAAFDVTGTLTQPDMASVVDRGGMRGMTQAAPVSIGDPCDCAAELQVDTLGLVELAKMEHDNAIIPLDDMALTNTQGEETLRLPCGRFYLERIAGSGSLTIEVTERTMLFIGQDISTPGSLTIDVAEDGILDLFVAGSINVGGALKIGDAQAPKRTRVYIGTEGSINLSGAADLGANLYAPNAELVLAGSAEIFGSVFVERINTSGGLTVHHDTAILSAADECIVPAPMTEPGDMAEDMSEEPEPLMCASCRECGNQACIDGECGGGCVRDEDCCAPLLCIRGACEPFTL